MGMDRDQYRATQMRFAAMAAMVTFTMKMDPSKRPHGRGRLRNGARIAKHEALQAAAKRARDDHHGHPVIACKGRTRASMALQEFIRPRIPLAGCLTPRALRGKRRK